MVEKSTFDQDEDPPIVYATALPAASAPSETFSADWACPKCTLLNSISKIHCDACYFRQPGAPLPYSHLSASGTAPVDTDSRQREHSAKITVEPPAETAPLIIPEDIMDAHTEEDPYHKKVRRRCRRKRRMAAGGVLGCVVGSIILCFPGAVLGAISGAMGARALSKRREHIKDERMAKDRLAAAQPAEGEPTKQVD
ncbi:MAG: hypothetical protein SGILL_002182 [Bacillariaceae sp.]